MKHDSPARGAAPGGSKSNGGSPKPQYLRIADAVENRILSGIYELNQAIPTFNELCEEFQVSLATVNKAIQELDQRGCVVRCRGKGVFATPNRDENGPPRPEAAQRTIGLVIPDLANPYFASMAKQIQMRLHEERFTVVTHSTDGSLSLWNQHLQQMIDDRLDGLILVPLDTSGADKEVVLWRLKIARIPFVYMNSNFTRVPSDFAISDLGHGIREIADYLLSLGHKRFGFVSAQPFMNLTQKKMDVFRERLSEEGIELASKDVIVSPLEHDEGGFEAARELLSRPASERPTAILASNDIIAFGVMSAAASLGLKVPNDVSVVGYDNIEASRFTSPPLTTIEQPVDLIAARAAKIILMRIQKKLPSEFQEHVFLPELVERGSCRRVGTDRPIEEGSGTSV